MLATFIMQWEAPALPRIPLRSTRRVLPCMACPSLAWGLLAALSVLVVNVSRLSLIGLFPAYYPAIHGSPGSDIAAWLSLALVVAISLLGVGREAFIRA
jgi:hypothetical protein